jgi:hypothetical protein
MPASQGDLVSLFDDPYDGYPSDFIAFHEANPQVLRTLRELALTAKNHGARKLGMKQLWEVCRWQMQLDLPDSKPKLNNNHTAYYSRLLEATTPELEGMFEMRAIRRVA